MKFEQINILELLPQRPPFILVNKLLYCDLKNTKTSMTVLSDNIFYDNGYLTEAGLIENIAQTCAVRMGYINKYLHNESIKIGFIGAIRNQAFLRMPKLNEELITEIETIQEVFQTTLVNATVHIGNELITSCEMKISITDISI